MSTTLPRKLSVHPKSPHYDEQAIKALGMVFVDGVHLPNCRAYDMDEGWACAVKDGQWTPKVFGDIRVTRK